MELSEVFGHDNSSLIKWSPDGLWLATVMQHRLIVRNAETLEVVRLCECLGTINDVNWSGDSVHILCVISKKHSVQIWSLSNPDWCCKITEGFASGLIGSFWCKDGKHVMTLTDFQLRLTVWNIETGKSVLCVKNPKTSSSASNGKHKDGIAFSHNGKFIAIAERKDSKDFIGIYDTSSWQLAKHFKVDTQDMVGMRWSPDDTTLSVWDHCTEYKVICLSLDGRVFCNYQAYENALGIKSVSWSHNSQFLAIGSFDQKIRILNALTGKVVAELPHTNTVNANTVAVYREVDSDIPFQISKYVLEDTGVVSLQAIKPAADKPNPKIGISTLKWSADNKYLFSRNDSTPNALWVWDVPRLSLNCVLIQKEAIKSVEWNPYQPKISICTGSRILYLWSAEGASCVQLPVEKFSVQHLNWNPTGSAIVTADKGDYLVCYCTV